jgi:predicted amidophosphoribosyltransferase
MSDNTCPHCGSKLPWVRDAFCGTCHEPLDEPPPVPRTSAEQEAFRARVEQEAKRDIGLLSKLGKLGKLLSWW